MILGWKKLENKTINFFPFLLQVLSRNDYISQQRIYLKIRIWTSVHDNLVMSHWRSTCHQLSVKILHSSFFIATFAFQLGDKSNSTSNTQARFSSHKAMTSPDTTTIILIIVAVILSLCILGGLVILFCMFYWTAQSNQSFRSGSNASIRSGQSIGSVGTNRTQPNNEQMSVKSRQSRRTRRSKSLKRKVRSLKRAASNGKIKRKQGKTASRTKQKIRHGSNISTKKGKEQGQQQQQAPGSSTILYKQGIDYYKEILKDNSVKAVSQYFQQQQKR